MRLILASRNAHKLNEIRLALSATVMNGEGVDAEGIDVASLDGVDGVPEELEETGATFEDNALQKARFVHQLTGDAVLAVGILTWEAGRLPVVALGLTLTWGFYAYLKKRLPIGPNQGFTLEVAILLVPALAYMVWLESQGTSHFRQGVAWDDVLLIGCGIVTAGPLMIYANGAKRLTLSTIAIMQYIAPTMIFLTAVFVFDEPFSQVKLMAFGLIWVALVIYSASILAARLNRGG